MKKCDHISRAIDQLCYPHTDILFNKKKRVHVNPTSEDNFNLSVPELLEDYKKYYYLIKEIF